MSNLPWIERTWEFGFPVGLYPALIERLRGTPARLEELAAECSAEELTRRMDGTWSIQENAGHLLCLEALPKRRLEELLSGAEVLTAADMDNRATEAADYNAQVVGDILAPFRRERTGLVRRLESLAPEDFAREALHPRLSRPMRLVDMCLFHADHDDHHLARMRELMRLVRSRASAE